ncbi:ribonuclease III, partial [Aureobasidium namibiae CBS 147.97]
MSSNQYQMKLERAEAIIGYHPQKPQEYYLWEALQVAGSGHTRIVGRSAYDGNKRLAIVGDTAMALALARPWYKKDETLGDWDSQRQRLLSNNNLARVARESGLVDCMVVNPRNPVQASTKLAAALVEAIVGAVWIDSDESIDAVRQVMETL